MSKYKPLLCFAVKSNNRLGFLQQIFNQGFGADVVSLGEIHRALKAGCKPEHIVFSGVGKQRHEIEFALSAGILCFNVESLFELELIQHIAAENKTQAQVSLRINPHIDAKTNPKITTGMEDNKFGIPERDLGPYLELLKQNESDLKLVGLSCHIGSQLTDVKPLAEASLSMKALVLSLRKQGFALEHLDMGGGLGIRYDQETEPDLSLYAENVLAPLVDLGLQLVLEPGRIIAGNSGVLVTKVLGCKTTPKKHFTIVDAAMNDLLRPTLYEAYHKIVPYNQELMPDKKLHDVVGPICESGDYLGKDRQLPTLKAGQYLVIRSCGAYAATMSSQYNSRLRAAEIMVKGSEVRIIKARETYADEQAGESLIDF